MLTKNLPQIIINTFEGARIVHNQNCLFSQLKKKLFNGKPILPIGAADFLFIFVAFSS